MLLLFFRPHASSGGVSLGQVKDTAVVQLNALTYTADATIETYTLVRLP
jgi:hypothetical protein